MGELRVYKLFLNICVGESGDRLTRDSRGAGAAPRPAPRVPPALDAPSDRLAAGEMKQWPPTAQSVGPRQKESRTEV